jgi:CheY-like chemotaxis protein
MWGGLEVSMMIRPDAGLREAGILVVDDEELNVLLLRRTLEGAGCTRVKTTVDPTRAWHGR